MSSRSWQSGTLEDLEETVPKELISSQDSGIIGNENTNVRDKKKLNRKNPEILKKMRETERERETEPEPEPD